MPFEVIGGPSLSLLEPQITDLEKAGFKKHLIHSGQDLRLSALGLSCDGWHEQARKLVAKGAKVIVILYRD